MKEDNFRDHVAFWLFGMSNSFAFIVMITAAQDIMSDKTSGATHLAEISNDTNTYCEPIIHSRECRVEALGSVLLANVIPAFIIKSFVPFFMHRIPFSILHILVCICQALSFLIVAFTTSVSMSLFGVVFSAISTGLGDICYLALASHYDRDTISWWSSGTGGSGILASISYAMLTEPHLANLSPKGTLLIMLIVPVQFLLTYFFLLTPAQTVYIAKLKNPRTWIVPDLNQIKLASTSYTAKSIIGIPELGYTPVDKMEPVKNIQSATMGEKARVILTLLKYIIPLTIVYFMDFFVNQGLTTFMIFDCSHGFDLSPESQYRWYQVVYSIGSFIARSSTNFFQLPYALLIVFPILETCNAIFCFLNSLYLFVPHIWMIFALIFTEGLIGGAAYSNTYFRIHKEIDPSVKEFSLSITTMSDVIGILAAGIATLPIHSIICNFYENAF